MLWIPFRSDPNGWKISYRSAKPEWDTLLFHLGENFSLFRCVSGDSVDFGKFRQNQRIGRHAFWDFPLKKKNHCHWIFHRGDEKERAKRKEKKRKEEGDEGMKHSRCERENTKEEEEEKEEKRDWREHLSHWRLMRRWNFRNEKKKKKEWSGEMRST